MENVINQSQTTKKPTSHQQTLQQLYQHLNQRILGQEKLMQRLLIALLADGHLLVEGVPGLAKTKAIKELAASVEGDFHRIQFTPDLLPADLTGTEIYRPQDSSFAFQCGPIFHNLVLADEINRAPAKVQSALLEAMAERQVTVGRTTYELPPLFLVMATQNPLEQEGTYPLPEAQLDRFLMYVRISYPDVSAEQRILKLAREEAYQMAQFQRSSEFQSRTSGQHQTNFPPVSQQTIFTARKAILELHLAPTLEEYLVRLVLATRNPRPYSEYLTRWLRFGASPRATISLDRCARAHAWLHDRDYVSPEDIHAVAADVLRHRIILSYEAEAEGITTDDFIKGLLQHVPVP